MDVLLLAFALLGAVMGSFVGVIAERAYTGQSFVTGRSRCNSCARALEPLDLVPVFSWLLARGRCRTCGSRVPAAYLVLEASLALLFALSYAVLGLSLVLPVFLALLVVVAFIVVYDLRHTIVPPPSSLTLAALALAYALLRAPSEGALGGALLAAGLISAFFLALHVFSGGRAMGLGDAPVAFSLALIAAPHALSGLLFSFWIGALYGIAVLVLRRGGPRMGIEVPFVPFMALGFLLAYFTGWDPLSFALY